VRSHLQNNQSKRVGGVVERLPVKCKALSLNSNTAKKEGREGWREGRKGGKKEGRKERKKNHMVFSAKSSWVR
jgi:hypothetical protein